MGVGWGVRGSKNLLVSYERASNEDSCAYDGIEKACPVVTIRHFECRQNRHFLYLSKISNAITEKSLKA